MTEWNSYTPTLANAAAKTVKLPNGKIHNYYWSGIHIVTLVHEYRQVGKRVELRANYKRLGLFDSVRFLVRTWIAPNPKEKP